MKRTLSLILALVLAFGALAMTGCGTSNATMPNPGEYTRIAITIDSSVESMYLSSSVELMVDDNARVVSAAPLDDDGALLTAGETFEGMTPGEAIEHVIYTAIDIGYLVKSAVEGDQNSINIITSGVSQYSKDLGDFLITKTKDLLAYLDIPGKVEKAADVTVEEIRNMIRNCGLYTEEEISDMNFAQLLIALATSRKYAAPFLTDELRAVYMMTKNHKIALAKSQATAGILGGLGDLYASVSDAYATAVNYYGSTITAIEEFNYNIFTSQDSVYQQALQKLQDAKSTYISLRATLATFTGEDRAALEAELALAEDAYNQAQASLDQITRDANEAITSLTTELNNAEAVLKDLEATLFDYNIKEAILGKLYDIDAAANAAKDAFFADFEAKYGDDINSAIESLTNTKKSIVNAIDKTTAEIKAKRDELANKFDEKYGDYIDFLAKKFHCEFGDEIYYAEKYMQNALNSAKDQLMEQLNNIPLPQLP